MTYKEAKATIREQLRHQRGYWDNIVSSALKEVAQDLGRGEANHLIRECNLRPLGWREEIEGS